MATYKRPRDAYDLLRRLRGAHLTLDERAVLMGQYTYADKNGQSSFVSEERLAEDLGVSVSTVRRHRRALKAKGWLVLVRRGRNLGKNTGPSEYEVVIPVEQPADVTTEHPTGQIRPVGQQVKTEQKPSTQQVKSALPTEGTEDRCQRAPNLSVAEVVGSLRGSPTEPGGAKGTEVPPATEEVGCPGCWDRGPGSHVYHCEPVLAFERMHRRLPLIEGRPVVVQLPPGEL